MATSSANIQAQTPPHLRSEVSAEVRSDVAACIGDERARSGRSSTIADCTGAAFRILRAGGVSEEALRDAVRAAGIDA